MTLDIGDVGTALRTTRSEVDPSELKAELRLVDKILYTRMGLLSKQLPKGKKWLKLDIEKLGKGLGIDVSQLSQYNDPTKMLDYLRSSGNVDEVGKRGRPRRRDHALPREGRHRQGDEEAPGPGAASGTGVDQLVKFLGDSKVPVDVWVGDDKLVRRMTMHLAPSGANAAASGFSMSMNDGPLRLRHAGQRQRAAGVRGVRRVGAAERRGRGAGAAPAPADAARRPDRARRHRGGRRRRPPRRAPGSARCAPRPAAVRGRARSGSLDGDPRAGDARLRDLVRAQRRAGARAAPPALRAASSSGARQRAPVGDAAADDPERVPALAVGRVGEHEPRPRGVQRAAPRPGAAQQRLEPLAPAPQPGGALVALLGGRRAHLRVDVREQRAARRRGRANSRSAASSRSR